MNKNLIACHAAFLALVFVGCDSGMADYKKQLQVKIGPVPELIYKRYEDVLFNLDTANFQQELSRVQADYRPFLNGDLSNPLAVKYLKDFALDPFSLSLYQKVKETFPDLKEVQTIVDGVYQHFYYYYPDLKLPERVFTCVSGLDRDVPSVMFVEDALVISLDWYLDGDVVYDLIGMPKYLSERTNVAVLAKDLGSQIYKDYLQHGHKQTNLLEEMVYAGKRLFFAEAMCPSLPDKELLGYSDAQMDWALENEGNLWADLVGNQRLYTSDYDAFRVFFADGPFTNEYSHEAPPRLGEFLGLNIVRSYMNTNDCTLQDLMDNTDLQGVFLDSKYKPKKY